MSHKIGEDAYDIGRFLMRGFHEIGNSLYPESQIPLRDHSGLYGARENRDVEPSQPDRVAQPPELEVDEPDLEM